MEQVEKNPYAAPGVHTDPLPPGAGPVDLDEQLADQTRRFLAHPGRFRIDRQNGVVYLSSIFKWFAKDFVNRYGSAKVGGGHSKQQRAVLNFVAGYLEAPDRQFLTMGMSSVT